MWLIAVVSVAVLVGPFPGWMCPKGVWPDTAGPGPSSILTLAGALGPKQAGPLRCKQTLAHAKRELLTRNLNLAARLPPQPPAFLLRLPLPSASLPLI